MNSSDLSERIQEARESGSYNARVVIEARRLVEEARASTDQRLSALAAEMIPAVAPDHLVREALIQIQIREEAKRRYAEAIKPPMEPFDLGTLEDLLARPAPPKDRIAGLIPWEAGTSIVAQRKTGKTTFTLNLARSLITGDPFLDRDVRKIDGNVGVLNFEVSGAQFGQWAGDVGVQHDRMVVANLRGRANPFAHPDHLESLADALRTHEVETLLVDPFGRAFAGTDQNSNSEVGRWLQELDRFAREMVGALDLVLVVHAGWKESGRSRGASALEDWPDSIITLTRGRNDVRQVSADGRDVEMDPAELIYDTDSRTLSLGGPVASGGGDEDLLAAVMGLVSLDDYEPVKVGDMEQAVRDTAGLRVPKGGLKNALALGEQRGLLAVHAGARNAKFIHRGGPSYDFGPLG